MCSELCPRKAKEKASVEVNERLVRCCCSEKRLQFGSGWEPKFDRMLQALVFACE